MFKIRIANILMIWFIFLLSVGPSPVQCKIVRDLVLTPRQGLQLIGKSIYYEEDSNEVLKNFTVHPWERTLKHVTFVTLFTDAAASAVAGNISKLKEYSDFLTSPYISKENANPVRFGDIVMLASGRLEQVGNHSFRFIEGTCSYDCVPERVWALWQVQKIRHRDQGNNFRYEMKFSVSPLRTENKENETYNLKSSEEVSHGGMYVRQNALKTYIQKEDDYPQSFGRIIYPEEIAFAQRRQDNENMPRNFRQVNMQANTDYRQVTPNPQPTFLRNIFQAPLPGLPPSPERLNIGEYIHGFGHTQATPKIELFPNVYNNLITRNNFPTQSTTFRPNYQIKLPRPDIYPQMQELVQFPQDRREFNLVEKKFKPPAVTHHFHHHFFMPGSGKKVGSEVNDANSVENQIGSGELQKELNRQVTPNFADGEPYETTTTMTKLQQDVPPAPQKISFPIQQFGDENIVEVTPPPPLRRPYGYTMYPYRHVTTQIPVLIYPIPADRQRTTVKPFIQSEPIKNTFRYSEPDPLYTNDGQIAPQVESPYYDNQHISSTDSNEASQLTSPENGQELNTPYLYESTEKSSDENLDSLLNHSEKYFKISTPKTTDFITTTEEPLTTLAHTTVAKSTSTTTTSTPITSPRNNPSTHISRYLTTPISTTTETATIKPFTSTNHFNSTSTTESPQSSIKVFKPPSHFDSTSNAESPQSSIKFFKPTNDFVSTSTTEPPQSSIKVLKPTNHFVSTSTTESPQSFIKVLKPTNHFISTSTTESPQSSLKVFKPTNHFISTSTTESPLSSISRKRSGRTSTTTAEPAVLKWKPKRRNQHSQIKYNAKHTTNEDNKAKSSNRHEQVAAPLTISRSNNTTTSTTTSTQSPSVQLDNEIFEVLTQKSVSKSVSIKVGENGEEIPLIVDDDVVNNEVKRE